MNTENNKKNSKKLSLFQWKMNEDELKKQVEEYSTLGIFKSIRKIAAVLLLFSTIIIFTLWLFNAISFYAIFDIIILLILSIFIYRGNRVAIILAMIYWTIEKILIDTPLSVASIIWWFIYMYAFWQAYQVEIERKKRLEKHE